MRRFFFRLFSLFRVRRADAELTREIAAHLQLLEDSFAARGLSADEARAAARRAFGGRVEQTKLQHRDARSFRWMDESWLDARLGARMLVKYPGLTIVGGVGMAVAIAISTASFAFFYAYMNATLPLDEGERIVALENWNIEANNEERQALHDYVLWRSELTSYQDLGAFRTVSRNLVIPGGVSEPVRIAEMTASGFRIARVPPLLGRPVLEGDERTGAPPVLVIGYEIWRSRFGSDPGVVGRQIRLGNVAHTLIGVMPEGFLFPVSHDYWTALRTDVARVARGQGPAIFIFGRLNDGVTLADANAELAAIGRRSAAEYPDTHRNLRPQVMPYARPILDIQDASLWQITVMQLMVSMLLLVVAVNVGILIYARTATRQAEIAVRTALGASRARIVAQLFIEALVLAGVAATAGLLLARFGLEQGHRIMTLETGRPPFWIDFGVPWAAVAYVIGLALVAALVAGVVPALQATSRRMQSTLRELSGSTGIRLGTTWTLLIVGQVAFAVAATPLAIGTGWSEVRDNASRPVFAAERYLAAAFTMDPDAPEGVDPSSYRRGLRAQFAKMQRELVARLEREPWAADVTLAARPPGQEGPVRVEVDGLAGDFDVAVNHIDIDFMAAFDAPTLTGRGFATADQDALAAIDSGPSAVIVNRSFVRRILADGNALGRRIRYPAQVDDDDGAREASRWYEIVGVVGDLHANSMSPENVRAVVYHPLALDQAATGSIVVRVTDSAPVNHIGRLRELSAAIDPSLRISAYPLLEIYRQANVAIRLVAIALLLVIASVLLLSAAGIYALMSFTVSQRRKEIGIRAALGADASQLLRSIFARAIRQLTAGIVAGVGVAVATQQMSGGELMGREGAVLVPATAAAVMVVGLLAAVGPARRGLRLQPTEALRE